MESRRWRPSRRRRAPPTRPPRGGIGRALYDALLADLDAAPEYLLAVAGITEPNPVSVALHTACGFTPVGTFHNVGEKLGRTWDVTWYERPLGLCANCVHQKIVRS